MKPLSSLLLAILLGTNLHAQISSFQHVIVIVQENRTPDNLFQGLCTPPYGSKNACSTTPHDRHYDIQASAWLDKTSAGGTIQPAPAALANKYDLSHAHAAFVNMCDANSSSAICKMDLATQYGWANYMFQTNQGPSFPAHQFLFGGTSAPSAADDAAGIFASENMSGASRVAGCAAPTGTTVEVIHPSTGESQKVYPCFEHQTMGDVLASAFTWRYYAPSAGSIWTAPNAIQHICQSTGPGGTCAGQDWTGNVDLKPADVLTDIALQSALR
jgi:hypothetical protein